MPQRHQDLSASVRVFYSSYGAAPHVVAPVYTYGSRARDVFLPALDGGRKWRYLFNESVEVEGGGWLRAFPAPLSEFPVFFPVPS